MEEGVDANYGEVVEAQFEEMPQEQELGPGPQQQQRKRKYDSHDWAEDQVFQTQQEQDEYFTAHPHWKKESTRNGKTGQKIRYYCNVASRFKGPPCPAKVLLFKPNYMLQNVLYKNDVEHVHEDEGQIPTKKPMDEATGERIKELMVLNKQPRIISHILRTDGNIAKKPTISQVSISC